MVWLILVGALAGAVDASPTQALTRALALEEKGDSQAALAGVESVIRTWPTWELPRLEAARLMLKLGGELDRAEAHLDIATALAPDNPRAHYLQGLLWEERGRPALAAQAYEAALLYRPSYEEARFRLAGLWMAEFQRQAARENFSDTRHFRRFALVLRTEIATLSEAFAITREAVAEMIQEPN